MIKSQQIYSPQNYVMAMTGECYIFMHDCDIIDEIHNTGVMSGESTAKLAEAINQFKATFLNTK